MMKYLFAILIFLHGAIHLLGFFKAFNLASIDHQLKLFISKPLGLLWLFNGLLFIYVTFLYATQYKEWYLIAFASVLLSQILILIFWEDAKAASLINLLILTISVISYSGVRFENMYKEDVKGSLNQIEISKEGLIEESDLEHLPNPVKKYLRYVGVVGKPRVKNVKVEFEGRMRQKEGSWFRFTSEQHNFFERPARLFFMKAKISGIPTYGYHSYQKEDASMTIKLMSLFPVVDIQSDELFRAETVMIFNDMCILAPATLIDRNIHWKAIDDGSVEATFTNKGVSISASLQFNKEGQLINFISDDKLEISDMNQYRFSTPVRDYKRIHGYNLPGYGEAIWHFPEGNFTYGEFQIKSVEYNVVEMFY